jgi:uncharacterized protein DUF5999
VIEEPVMCPHEPRCASASAPDCAAARVIAAHPEQGWNLLCNHVIIFDDGGMLLPTGASVAPGAAPSSGRPEVVVAA